MSFKVPVLFIVFNRPDCTAEVFEAIRRIAPLKLYVAADGPRNGKEGESEKCEAVRTIVKSVDWDCKVDYLFQDSNLGCKGGVSAGIDWFFKNEERGIILEDDCLPNQSFFSFCEELLERYKDDTRVMTISGRNPLGTTDHTTSYFFSRVFKEWGWASWRRAWQTRDLEKPYFDRAVAEGVFKRTFEDAVMGRFYEEVNYSVHYQNHNTWDYQWQFNIYAQNGLVIVPSKNLVDNVGLDSGTHFGTNPNILKELYKVACYEIEMPIKHPDFVTVDNSFDKQCFYSIHPYLLPKEYPLTQRIKDSIKYRLSKLFKG